MPTRLLIGKTGTGKTEQLHQKMIKASELTGKDHQLLIVPEQATLEAQQTLIHKHPRHCVSSIEVLSFQRLAYRVGSTLGIAGRTLIDDVGKNILIRQIIESDQEAFPFLNRYVHKKGYISELRKLLTEFSRYTLDQGQLDKANNQIEASVLKIKLADLQELYRRYSREIEDRFLSGETVMDRLLTTCHTNGFIRQSHIYIDGFYGFTPLQYQLIKSLSVSAQSVTVSITMDPSLVKTGQIDESQLYYESKMTYDRLKAIFTEDPSADYQEILLESVERDPVKEAIRDNLYQYPYTAYQAKASSVMIGKCLSTRQEMDYLRDSIFKLVGRKGYRYKDIAIFTGNPGQHRQVLEEKFIEAGIPYYFDNKKPAVANDGIAFVLGIVKAYMRQLDYSAFFECLKSGWIQVDQDLLDHMENYVIRYGIRGFSKWSKPWVYKVPDIHAKAEDPMVVERLASINKLREHIMVPLLDHRIKGRQAITVYIRSLYDLMEYFGIEKQLQTKADYYHSKGDFERSREYNQIYKVILDLLDQLNSLGDRVKVTYSDFYDLLEAGFETIELGMVPANVDQIIIGDLTRSRIGRKKAVFIIGVNEGVVPSLKEGAGLLTDEERQKLAGMGVQLAPTATSSLFRDQFYIYMALQGYSERLYLSYTVTDEDGKVTRPSHLLNIIQKILPGVARYDVGALYEEGPVASTPKVAYRQYLEDRQKGRPEDPIVREWLWAQKEWQIRLEKSLLGERESFAPRSLSKGARQDLYGYRLSNSVSRLEQFAQCPFRHFVTYGLKASERETFEITMPHMGMIFHRIIELFSKRLILREMTWDQVEDGLRTKWVDELMAEVLGEDIYSAFFDNKRNLYRIERLKTMVDRALWTIGFQITQGDFRPRDAEWRFDGKDHPLASINLDLKEHRKMSLRGTIDRVDHHRIAGMDYITVVDYKSSPHDFDVNQLYAGLQLQLLVYLNAACEIKEASLGRVAPAGVFYFRIDDPFLSTVERLSQEDRDKGVQEKLRLQGLVVDDEKVVRALDKNFSRKSRVIPVSRNKNGGYAKASKLIAPEDMALLRTYTQQKISELGNCIVSGDVSARPYKRGKTTACDWCNYRSICQFDEGIGAFQYREVLDEDQEQVLEYIREEVKEG